MRLRGHQVAVGDQAGDHAAAADARDEGVEVRVEHRLAAAEGDDRRARGSASLSIRAIISSSRHRLRDLVVLVAVAAVDVAAADRHDVHEQGMVGARRARERTRGPTARAG